MAYKKFAYLYDEFMDTIPYDEWAGFVIGKLEEYGFDTIRNGEMTNILELGCGTGNMSGYLCRAGYMVEGIDLSEDMVKLAAKKRLPNFSAEKWDMRVPYNSGKQYDCVISLCDSMNYLVSRDDLELTFKAVARELKSGGIFLFDMKHEEFYRDVLGDGIFADRRKNCSYIWENEYDEKKRINRYAITFYKRSFLNIYKSFTEHHVQRCYTRRQIEALAAKAGLSVVECIRRDERDYYIMKGNV